jgi:glycosyltransferase involved in cell wall biosynthesis
MVSKIVEGSDLNSQYSLASIIVLVYNNIEFTSRSLESLIYSTHFPYELIIVDNGSDMPTKKWINEFIRYQKGKDKDIKLISLNPDDRWSRQKKIYSAKNVALELAQGDLLVINDNDLAYEPFWLHYAAYLLETFPEAGLVGLQRYKGKTHKILDTLRHNGIRVFSMNTVEGCNLILSRPVYERIGNFKEEPQTYDAPFSNYKGCDVEFTYRLKPHNLLCIVPDIDIIRHIRQPKGYKL